MPNILEKLLKNKKNKELSSSEQEVSDEWSKWLNASPYWQYESLHDIKKSIDGKLHLPKTKARSDYLKLINFDIINCIIKKQELDKNGVDKLLNRHNKDWGFPSSNRIRQFMPEDKWNILIHIIRKHIYLCVRELPVLRNLKSDKNVDCRNKGWFKRCLKYTDFDFEKKNVPEEFKDYVVP